MILGIDIGTTGTKTILLSNDGKIVHYSYQGYACSYPQPGYVEQDITVLMDAVIQTVRACTEKVPANDAVEAMCVSVQSGTLVPLHKDGTPFGNAISWLDTRCDKECRDLLAQYGEDIFYRKTGWKLSPSFNFIQICKLRRDMPEQTKDLIFANVSDCVTNLLVGEYYTDVNSAGNLQLLNVEKGEWDDELLEIAGIEKSQLGTLVPCGAFLGYVRPDTAKLLGLGDKVRVYAGAQDQYCAAVGAGVHEPGDAMLSTGTSWVLMNITKDAMFESKSYPAVAKHIVGSNYASFVYTPAGGSAFKWLKNSVLTDPAHAEQTSYDSLTEIAQNIPAGSDGLMFHPYLGGTLYPTWSSMRGTFHGLDFAHGRGHMVRAVLEGVAYEFNLMVQTLRQQGLAFDKLTALGGATRSPLWMQTVSDITGLPLRTSDVADIAPIGAAIIAAVGAGMYSNYREACNTFVSLAEHKEYTPNPANREGYRAGFEKYCALSNFLQKTAAE